MASRMAELWRAAGQRPGEIAIVSFAVGAVFCVAANAIGVDHVIFSGKVNGIPIKGLDQDFNKQVGFMLAPNWGIACLVFIPLILFFMLKARGTVEGILNVLLDRRMLRRRDGAALDRGAFEKIWHGFNDRLMWGLPIALGLLFVLIILLDFVPVVFNWLRDPVLAGTRAAEIALTDPVFEFDWSVAALFSEGAVDPVANIVFSFLVYIWVALLFSSLLVFGMFWFAFLAIFLSPAYLRRHDLLFVPDPRHHNESCGFDVFGPLFQNVMLAALITSFMALGVHVQNVFLRSAQFDTWYGMVFGLFSSAQFDLDPANWVKLFSQLLTPGQAMQVHANNLQFILTGVGLYLIALIVVCFLSGWLYTAASEGSRQLQEILDGKEGRPYTRDQRTILRARLDEMDPWPPKTMSLREFVVYVGLIITCMFYVNLLSLVLIAVLLQLVFAPVAGWFFSKKKPRSRRYDSDNADFERAAEGVSDLQPSVSAYQQTDITLAPPDVPAPPVAAPPDQK